MDNSNAHSQQFTESRPLADCLRHFLFWAYILLVRIAKILARLRVCTGSPKPTLFPYAISIILHTSAQIFLLQIFVKFKWSVRFYRNTKMWTMFRRYGLTILLCVAIVLVYSYYQNNNSWYQIWDKMSKLKFTRMNSASADQEIAKRTESLRLIDTQTSLFGVNLQ